MRRFLIELLLVFCGCDVEGSVGLGFDPQTEHLVSTSLRIGPHHEVDILFVIDNSPGMLAKQADLRSALPILEQELPADRVYHFGVITTDLGAGPKGFANCTSPGGDALLVSRDCLNGPRFVEWTGDGSNLPPNRSLTQTLDCMMDVGDTGCGFEQPLEAARRALSSQPVNTGFLRDQALLILVFLTDEDDCSAPVDSPVFAPPLDSFHCTQAGVVCGFPPKPPTADVALPMNDCMATAGGSLYDLSRYRDFFFSSNGLKRDPNDVHVVSLTAPGIPLTVSLDGQGNPQLDPICGTPDGPAFPAVRLHMLLDQIPTAVQTSICTAGAYQYALGGIANSLLAEKTTLPCLSMPIADPEQPDCNVTVGGIPLPACSFDNGPCWELVDRLDCLPVYNPRSKREEQLALNLRFVDGPADATCTVIAPLN